MKTSDYGIIILLSVGLLANSIADIKLEKRVSRLEKRGEVSVELEPIGNVLPKVTEFNGPSLYNNKTKIVLFDKKEFTCLSENVFYESGHQSYIGKIAVLQTVYNRAETGKWGYSFCNVIHADKQFSWTLKEQKKPRGSAWVASKDAVRAFLNGVRVRNLSSTDHYHANYASPYWNVSMKKTAIIGDHIFYASR